MHALQLYINGHSVFGPFNCVCNETLALIAPGIKNTKIAIFFSFDRWRVEGRGAGIRPSTAVPPLPAPS